MNLFRSGSILLALGLTLFAFGARAQTPTAAEYDEIFPATLNEITAGPTPLTQTECEAKPNALWISARWTEKGTFSDSEKRGQACIRYFPSDQAANARRPLLFINGDRVEPEGFKDGTYRKQVAFANLIAKEAGNPAVVIGRPGVYGSTGANHLTDRRTPQEAALIYAAIEALKARYGWSHLLLSGQSGGGGLVAAMLTQGRDDIDCAAMSSGAVAVRLRTVDQKFSNPGRDATGRYLYETYDPMDHVTHIAPDPKRRLFIVADRRDKRVSYNSQRQFFHALKAQGIHALFVEQFARDKNFHALTWPGVRAVGACADGRSDDEIIALLSRAKNEPAEREVLRSDPKPAL
ncbi:MAG: prolyl oligopeptidase family serine peptidase [Propionivibrio sp.]